MILLPYTSASPPFFSLFIPFPPQAKTYPYNKCCFLTIPGLELPDALEVWGVRSLSRRCLAFLALILPPEGQNHLETFSVLGPYF